MVRRLAEEYQPTRRIPGYDSPYEEPDIRPVNPSWERPIERGGFSGMGQNLRQLYESLGPQETCGRLRKMLDEKKLTPEQFSLRELAEAFCGRAWVEQLNPRSMGRYGSMSIMEAGEGVDVSAFSNIVGQIYYSKIAEGWKNATLVTDQIFERQPTDFDGEKIPWLSHVIQEGSPIHPGMPYPEANFGERFVTTPSTLKWGLIVSLTKEMIFFDRTGQALRAAGETGYKLGYNKEKRNLVTFLGMVNTYSLNGTTYNTYNVGPQSPPSYANAQAGTPLVDYSSIQTPLTLASQILDPDTLNPLDTPEMKDLFVMPARELHAQALNMATEYRGTNPPFNSSPQAPEPYGNLQMISGNPWKKKFNVLTSPIAYQLMTGAASTPYAPAWVGLTSGQVNEYWWVGDFKRSFIYMENWPITTVQAPPQSIKDFEQDLIVRFKSSERGTPAIMDPRYTFQLHNS
jgi:hypothetical protein